MRERMSNARGGEKLWEGRYDEGEEKKWAVRGNSEE